MEEKFWDTSVRELMEIFRDSLSKLIPDLRKARLPIGIRPGVDAWDDISEMLYRHIVVEAIRSALPEEEMDGFQLPVYETEYENYANLSFIEVIPRKAVQDPVRPLAFHSFKTPEEGSSELSIVLCRIIDDRGSILDNKLAEFSFHEVNCLCCYRKSGLLQLLDGLKVVL